jgi:hypothetical protein
VASSVDRHSKGEMNFSARRDDASATWSATSLLFGRNVDTSRSFLGTPQDSGQLPCVMPTRCFRPSVSPLYGDLLDHELPCVERDVTGALALQLSR